MDFCPYAKGECRQHKCMFWDEGCLIVRSLKESRQQIAASAELYRQSLQASEEQAAIAQKNQTQFLELMKIQLRWMGALPEEVKEQMPQDLIGEVDELLRRFDAGEEPK